MHRHLARFSPVALLCLALLAGCVYYPATGTYAPYGAPGPSTFDRSYDAALGAMTDQGLGITVQDRSSGTVSGVRGAQTVTASVRPQADGTTRVEFNTRGDSSQDPGLAQRVLNAYNSRMGR